ncbi:glycosyltransferase family 71 protein [Myriangium duriaei CBS 260.36]|uniref:Glycosyltransferase family 71 protein n=1 Tax=Myriangium duriaei CBS 260.36 TaxID=1168546 RepID=A0A9P4MKT2_9PEZI|nr:glycosyltransferase family 71 protein [Myriangium duriaei CBS 260.36]
MTVDRRFKILALVFFGVCIYQVYVIYHLGRVFTSVHTPDLFKSESSVTKVTISKPATTESTLAASTSSAQFALPTQLVEILSSNVTHKDFGYMAKQVSHLGELIEQRVDPTLLEMGARRLFPWWQPETLRYYPWMDPKSVEDRKTGIVMSVATKHVRYAAQCIAGLRYVLNSTLPIEVAFAGDADLTPHMQAFLQSVADDVTMVDLTKVFNNDLINLKGWDTKPFSILASRYQQTILMDADAAFFESPDNIFEEYPSLKETGTLYSFDRNKWVGQKVDRRQWLTNHLKTAGHAPSDFLNSSSIQWQGFVTEVQDSAIVMVDKGRPNIYLSMLFTSWMNTKGPRDEAYDKWYGDKETYWIANELLGVPYSFEAWSSARFGNDADAGSKPARATEAAQAKKCSIHMVHSNADASAPLWANGVFDYLDWTHWYLGTSVREAIHEAKTKLNFTSAVPVLETNITEQDKKTYKELIMNTQPLWDGSCKQHHPEEWKPLPASWLSRVDKMRAIAKNMTEKWEAANKHEKKDRLPPLVKRMVGSWMEAVDNEQKGNSV